MERLQLFNRATYLLSVLHTQIKMSSTVGMTDINRHSEVFYRDLLNMVFGYKLENVNLFKANFPAIDLAEQCGICIQVTSNKTAAKVRHTLKTFKKHNLSQTYTRLVILILGPASTSLAKSEPLSDTLSFNPKTDIWNDQTVIHAIEDLDIETLREVVAFLSENIEPRCDDQLGQLPRLLLENLAMRFGTDNPDASNADIESFLMEKAKEYHELRKRLEPLNKLKGQISEFVGAAQTALEQGDFAKADDFLAKGEDLQLEWETLPAVENLSELRNARANAALINGSVAVAVQHFEQGARYYLGIDDLQAARARFEYSDLLRGYAYRYQNCEALYAAQDALNTNIAIYEARGDQEKRAQNLNALGGVCLRLAQFDRPENANRHAQDAKTQYQAVRNLCSSESFPEWFHKAGINLANVYRERSFAASDAEYERNLSVALALQLSAVDFFTTSDFTEAWGILQHNLGATYNTMSTLRTSREEALRDIESSVSHLESSFKARDPESNLQYWIASCRSLGEALMLRARYLNNTSSEHFLKQAYQVLVDAESKISANEHPHQWAEIQALLAECRESVWWRDNVP